MTYAGANGKTLEAFNNKPKKDGKKYTMPTDNNPFMNVLLTEITDNPDRAPAAPSTRKDVKEEILKKFKVTHDLEMDTTDAFDQAKALRFYTSVQPSTIPGDLDKFKKFLSKGIDDPDYSSAAPARNGKILNEGYVNAKGSKADLSNTTAKPSGTKPSSSSRSTTPTA
jgi:hypothetical protein